MRNALLAVGILCCLIGAEFLLVDKIVLHKGVWPPDKSVSWEDSSAETSNDGTSDEAQRHIDLPDSGGFVLVAIGAICLMYFVALRRHKER